MKDGKHWPLIIVGILVGNFLAVGTLIYLSGSSGADVVVDDDYYQRAVSHDEAMAQQRENARLGWSASVKMTAAAGAGEAQVTVRITDRDGKPVTRAKVAGTTFHRARAAHRLPLRLTEAAAGTYRTAIPTTRRGLWQVRLIAERRGETFTHDTVADLGNTGARASMEEARR